MALEKEKQERDCLVGELAEAKTKLSAALEGKTSEVAACQEQIRTLDTAVTHFETRADDAEREAQKAQALHAAQSGETLALSDKAHTSHHLGA